MKTETMLAPTSTAMLSSYLLNKCISSAVSFQREMSLSLFPFLLCVLYPVAGLD